MTATDDRKNSQDNEVGTVDGDVFCSHLPRRIITALL